jgi:murein DD-endopeptidase MepM/ murein hydrolase activator NlpD
MNPTTSQRKVVFSALLIPLAVLLLTLVPSLLTPAGSAASSDFESLDPETEMFLPAPEKMLLTDQVAGQILTVTELDPTNLQGSRIAALDPINSQASRIAAFDPIDSQASRIAACGQGVIYLSREDRTLWVNLHGGIGTWNKVTAGTRGEKIACDRRHLYSLASDGILFHANIRSDGQLRTLDPDNANETRIWTAMVDGKVLWLPDGTDEIGGGMGNIYALKFNSSTHIGTLYSSQLANPTSPAGYVQGAADSWVQLANNLGTSQASGAGSKAMFTAYTTSLGYRKTNRIFGVNPDGKLYYTDGLLDGVNWWTEFPNAGLEILTIAAEDSNTLYALTKVNSTKHLVRFSFNEGNCTDHLDNDANGQIDEEDAYCRQRLATSWCQSHTGSYCIDRIESSSNGYSHALITCNSGRPPAIQPGLCTKVRPGADKLTEPRTNPEPLGAGHYCNVIMPDGTWYFEFDGAKPCDRLARLHPGGKIVRAGIYSTTGLNNVHVRCNNGKVTLPEGVGRAPLVAAKDGVGHSTNECVFMVSPKAMQVFNAPFPTSVWGDPVYGARGYSVGHVFDHVTRCELNDPGCPCPFRDCPMNLESFGNGDVALSTWLDNNGRNVTSANGGVYPDQVAYDYNMNEGTPLRSLGYGTVVGSRDRDISSYQTNGTPYQGEIYIRYQVGSDPVYAETFVAYYAHLGRRVVVTGQTVEPGQLIGYSGTTGSSYSPHVHFGLIRLSNTNGRTAADGNKFGYHIQFWPMLNDWGYNPEAAPGAVDPYGWRAGGIDPMGYRWSFARSGDVTGIGAWSPKMWRDGEVPPYPPAQ